MFGEGQTCFGLTIRLSDSTTIEIFTSAISWSYIQVVSEHFEYLFENDSMSGDISVQIQTKLVKNLTTDT